MRIKSAYKYQLLELRKPVLIFYIVVAALLVLAAILQILLKPYGYVSFSGGFGGATIIFLFVCGLNAFRQQFHMFLANGISRRTMFVSSVAAFGTISIGMALIDGVMGLIMSAIMHNSADFAAWYGISAGMSSAFSSVVDSFVWAVFCYMAAAMAGLFITTAYYRMNKPLKLIVSIGVPVLLIIVLPILDASLFNGAITLAVGRFISAVTSLLGEGNPYSTVLANVFSILISGGLAWLLMRRATVKS